MKENALGAIETRFAELIWEHAPLASGALVTLCEEHLHWKKSTTYTVLKKLCDRGLFQNNGGTVTVVVTREEFAARQSEEIVRETFSGSLPAFVAAFTSRNPLSEGELSDLQALIDAQRKKH
ncbi:MAG: BlaI/MecI/CopY family transcriptional regulator [Ruminococcaceae bacterium]|nr:BlaI/MecI/CopY family transcriptional regulator [Oscillospiraceae bacterium]